MRNAMANQRRYMMCFHHASVYALCLLFLLPLLTACLGQSAPPQNNKPTPATQTSSIVCSSHSSNPVTLTMYYGSEKQAWMQDVVADFNNQHITACDGPITVKATPIGSGQSMQQIVDGTIKPDIWSPAGAVWLTLINQQWQEKHNSQLIATGAEDSPPLVTSPVV